MEAPMIELRLKIEQDPTNIALITEPSQSNSVLGPRLSSFPPLPRKQRGDTTRQRSLIVMEKTLARKATLLTQFTTKDIATVKLGNWVISSVYWSMEDRIVPPIIKRVNEWTKQNHLNMIIAGDFNARHASWGDKTNAKGIQLSNWISETGLVLHNIIGQATREEAGHKSTLDLTLTNERGARLIKNWQRGQRNGSDHYLLSYEAKAKIEKKETKKVTKINFEACKRDIEKKIQNFSTAPSTNREQLNQKCDRLVETVKTSIKDNSEVHYISTKSTQWYTKELRELKNKWKEEEEKEDEEATKEASKAYTKALNKADRMGWQQRTSTNTFSANSKLIKVIGQPRKTPGLPPLIDPTTGTHFSTEEDMVNHTADTLIGGERIPQKRPDKVLTQEQYIRASRIAEDTVKATYIQEAIKAVSNKKSAAGPDTIQWKMLEIVLPAIQEYLESILKDCIILGTIPEQWLKTKGILLKKPGRDATKTSGYRTITLSSVMFKLLEKLLIRHQRTTGDIYNRLHELQYGFIPGRGSEDALTVLCSKIEEAIAKRSKALVLYLDIRGAFDNVKKEELILAMEKHGCEPSITSVFEEFLYMREIELHVGTHTTKRHQLPGGTQGNVAMPLKWNMTTTDLLTTVNTREHLQAQADDMASLVEGNNVIDLIRRTQWVLDQVTQWCDRLGLELNTNKTRFVLYTHKRSGLITPESPKLIYKGHYIEQASEYRYLGVILDQRLDFKLHFEHVVQEAMKVEMAATRMAGVEWGLDASMRRKIWETIGLAKISYGSIVTVAGLINPAVKEILLKADYYAAKRISQCCSTTPKYLALGMSNITLSSTAILKSAIRSQAKTYNNHSGPHTLWQKGTTFKGHRSVQPLVSLLSHNIPLQHSIPPYNKLIAR
eukprot:sb/3461903/